MNELTFQGSSALSLKRLLENNWHLIQIIGISHLFRTISCRRAISSKEKCNSSQLFQLVFCMLLTFRVTSAV